MTIRRILLNGRGAVGLDGTHTTFGVIDGLKAVETYTFGVAAVTPYGEGAGAVTEPAVGQ